MLSDNIQSSDESLGDKTILFSVNISQGSMFMLNIGRGNLFAGADLFDLNDIEEEYNERREEFNTMFGVETFEELKDANLKFFTSSGFPVRCVKN